MPTVALPEPVVEPESEDEASGSEADVAPAGEEDEDEEIEEGGTPQKLKLATKVKAPARLAKKRKTVTASAARTPKKSKSKKMPHPQASTTHIPSSVPNLDDLPVDPYQRALRLLHVGATPESLPCREEEFVEVLSKVEEGVEWGGGGCLCELSEPLQCVPSSLSRYCWCTRNRKDGDCPCGRQRIEAESRGWCEFHTPEAPLQKYKLTRSGTTAFLICRDQRSQDSITPARLYRPVGSNIRNTRHVL